MKTADSRFLPNVGIVECTVFGRWDFQTVSQERVTNAANAS